jgi:hypothetical protein
MPKLSLSGMNIQALLSLRDQVDKRLVECRSELEKQLAALGQVDERQGFEQVVLEGHESPTEISKPIRRNLGRSWGEA